MLGEIPEGTIWWRGEVYNGPTEVRIVRGKECWKIEIRFPDLKTLMEKCFLWYPSARIFALTRAIGQEMLSNRKVRAFGEYYK